MGKSATPKQKQKDGSKKPEVVDQFPGWHPMPPLERILFGMNYPCECGELQQPSHHNACRINMMHWALNAVLFTEYRQVIAVVLQASTGGPSVTPKDVAKGAPFSGTVGTMPYMYSPYESLYPPARTTPESKRKAMEVAQAWIELEERRYWTGEWTHRAILEASVRCFAVDSVPAEYVVQGLKWKMSATPGKKWAPMAPAWTPRDWYTVEAKRAAARRGNTPFDVFGKGVVRGVGSHRGVVVRDGHQIRPSNTFLKRCIMADIDGESQEGYVPFVSEASWVEWKDLLESLRDEAVAERGRLDALLAKPVLGDGEQPSTPTVVVTEDLPEDEELAIDLPKDWDAGLSKVAGLEAIFGKPPAKKSAKVARGTPQSASAVGQAASREESRKTPPNDSPSVASRKTGESPSATSKADEDTSPGKESEEGSVEEEEVASKKGGSSSRNPRGGSAKGGPQAGTKRSSRNASKEPRSKKARNG